MLFCQAGGPQLNGIAHLSSGPAAASLREADAVPNERATIHRGSSFQAASSEGAGTSQASKRQRNTSSVPPEVCSSTF